MGHVIGHVPESGHITIAATSVKLFFFISYISKAALHWISDHGTLQ